MDKNFLKMSNEIFDKYINNLCENLSDFIQKNEIKID